MGRIKTIARRSFLIGSAAILGGVAFGAYAVARELPNPLLKGLGADEAALTPFVKITAEGITLIVPRADSGQGIASLQAYLIAEELDFDPHTATLDPGQPDAVYHNGTVASDGLPFPLYDQSGVANAARATVQGLAKVMGLQITGGSSSTPDMHEKLRQAGASARETLKEAAARRSGLTRAELSTGDGAVVLPDGTRIPYTELAGEAAALDPIQDVPLRSPDQWRLLGKPMTRTDMVAKCTGAQIYGVDIRLPEMVFATVRRNPGIGGPVLGYDDTVAKAMPGVSAILAVKDGVAVIADNTWRAFQAADAVQIDWGAPDYPATSAEMWAMVEANHIEDNRNSRLRDDGDVTQALGTGAPFTAEYRVPFLAHAGLEPVSATVKYSPERLDIWTATQVPQALHDKAAELSGVAAENVVLHVLHAGGSFGRRLDIDYVMPAIECAMAVPGTAVQMTLTREEDMTHDFPRPMQMARCQGLVQDGQIAALNLDTIGPSVTESWFGRLMGAPPGPDTLLVAGAYDQPYAIPDYRVSGYKTPVMVPVGSWRSPGSCANAFFHDTFVDELIHAAGADPLAERLRLIDHADSRRVIEAVAEICNWAGPAVSKGRGRGIAFVYAHGVPVAAVVEVAVSDRGIRIEKAWVAADCGTVYDPVNAEAQLTGSLIFGLAHAMNCQLTYADHAPIQTNFHNYEGMRMYQSPQIEARLLGQATQVRGLGEPATAVAAPALGNAIFAATGQRLREMPFSNTVTFA